MVAPQLRPAKKNLESRIEWVLRPGRWLVFLDYGTGATGRFIPASTLLPGLVARVPDLPRGPHVHS